MAGRLHPSRRDYPADVWDRGVPGRGAGESRRGGRRLKPDLKWGGRRHSARLLKGWYTPGFLATGGGVCGGREFLMRRRNAG